MAYRWAVSATRGEHRVGAGPPSRAAASCSASASSGRPSRRACGVVEVVDDLVGVAGEAVQRVHGGPPGRREQPGGEEVGAAVAGVQRAARGVGGPQRGVVDPRGVQLGARHPAQLARGSAATAGAEISAGGFSGGSSAGCGLLRAPAASRSGSGFTSDQAASRPPPPGRRPGSPSCRGRPRRWGSRR